MPPLHTGHRLRRTCALRVPCMCPAFTNSLAVAPACQRVPCLVSKRRNHCHTCCAQMSRPPASRQPTTSLLRPPNRLIADVLVRRALLSQNMHVPCLCHARRPASLYLRPTFTKRTDSIGPSVFRACATDHYSRAMDSNYSDPQLVVEYVVL